MNSMTNLEKFGLAAALIIACTFFYMKYMYDPQTKVLEKTLAKRNKIVKELNQVRDIPPLFQVKKTIEKEKETLKEFLAQTRNLSVKTGDPDEITELLSEINGLIQSSRLNVNLIVPKPGIQGPFFKWSPYEMDLSGSFGNFMTFMEKVKALDDAVEISNLALAGPGGGGGALNIKFLMKI